MGQREAVVECPEFVDPRRTDGPGICSAAEDHQPSHLVLDVDDIRGESIGCAVGRHASGKLAPAGRIRPQDSSETDGRAEGGRDEILIAALRKGDRVYVIPFAAEATIDRIRRKRKTVRVILGSKQLEVGADDICSPEDVKPR